MRPATWRGGDSVERVESRAKFAVKLLGITAFAYDHSNVENWRDGCLQAIESRTDSNSPGMQWQAESLAAASCWKGTAAPSVSATAR